jgi:hypothetical protein
LLIKAYIGRLINLFPVIFPHNNPFPLLITTHDSNRSGIRLLERWAFRHSGYSFELRIVEMARFTEKSLFRLDGIGHFSPPREVAKNNIYAQSPFFAFSASG